MSLKPPPDVTGQALGFNKNYLEQSAVIHPRVLAAVSFLLLGSEIVLDIESLSDLLGRLALIV